MCIWVWNLIIIFYGYFTAPKGVGNCSTKLEFNKTKRYQKIKSPPEPVSNSSRKCFRLMRWRRGKLFDLLRNSIVTGYSSLYVALWHVSGCVNRGGENVPWSGINYVATHSFIPEEIRLQNKKHQEITKITNKWNQNFCSHNFLGMEEEQKAMGWIHIEELTRKSYDLIMYRR